MDMIENTVESVHGFLFLPPVSFLRYVLHERLFCHDLLRKVQHIGSEARCFALILRPAQSKRRKRLPGLRPQLIIQYLKS
jgi:hypothetical protein